MRHFVIIITILLAACLASSSLSPIDTQRRFMNRPTAGRLSRVTRPTADRLSRVTRADQYVKGLPNGSKTYTVTPFPNLRKGEYICGNKVCKLQPGDKPPCKYCQYPL